MKICINGIPATTEEIMELERKLRFGIIRAFGSIRNGFIYLKTEVI